MSKKKLIAESAAMKVQRSSAYIVISDSARAGKSHVTYQVKAHLIVYTMVFILCCRNERSQSYGCLTTIGGEEMFKTERLLRVSPEPTVVPKPNLYRVKEST